jgi:hypothetical protein
MDRSAGIAAGVHMGDFLRPAVQYFFKSVPLIIGQIVGFRKVSPNYIEYPIFHADTLFIELVERGGKRMAQGMGRHRFADSRLESGCSDETLGLTFGKGLLNIFTIGKQIG